MGSEANPTLEEIEPKVMCTSCGGPLSSSSGPPADRMRVWINRRIDQGWTRSQIIDGLVEEYGGSERVLVTPPRRGRSLMAWAGPVVAAVLVALVGARVLRRWHGNTVDSASSRATPGTDH
jgi:cytochrome c-type biogenesis protein CcmH/NrfF